jgi:hypothetical protein
MRSMSNKMRVGFRAMQHCIGDLSTTHTQKTNKQTKNINKSDQTNLKKQIRTSVPKANKNKLRLTGPPQVGQIVIQCGNRVCIASSSGFSHLLHVRIRFLVRPFRKFPVEPQERKQKYNK